MTSVEMVTWRSRISVVPPNHLAWNGGLIRTASRYEIIQTRILEWTANKLLGMKHRWNTVSQSFFRIQILQFRKAFRVFFLALGVSDGRPFWFMVCGSKSLLQSNSFFFQRTTRVGSMSIFVDKKVPQKWRIFVRPQSWVFFFGGKEKAQQIHPKFKWGPLFLRDILEACTLF